MKATLIRFSPLLILALMWEGVSRLGLVSQEQLPALSSVVSAWIDLALSADFWINAADSFYRGIAGLGLAIVLGAALGIGMAWSRAARAVLGPLVEVFYPLPKSALIPVTALWLGLGDASKILLIFMGCMLSVTIGAFNGARGAERTLLWSAQSLGAGRWRLLRDVLLPSALPDLLNGIRTALATAFVLLVVAEMIAAQHGIGYLIGTLGNAGLYAPMFAVVFTIALFGFAADRLFQRLTRRLLQWR